MIDDSSVIKRCADVFKILCRLCTPRVAAQELHR